MQWSRRRVAALVGTVMIIIGAILVVAGTRGYDFLGDSVTIDEVGWTGFGLFGLGIVTVFALRLFEPRRTVSTQSFPELFRVIHPGPKRETLQWTFRHLTTAQLIYFDRVVAELGGFWRHKGSFEDTHVEIWTKTNWPKRRNDVTFVNLQTGKTIGVLETDTFRNPVRYVHNNGEQYILKKEQAPERLDAWVFETLDGRRLALTTADFHARGLRAEYSFTTMDIRQEDPSPWLLAIVALHNILNYNFPSY